MKFLLTFSILITVLMTSSWSQEPQSTQGGGVWLVIENRAEVPVKDPKGGFKSTNTKLHEIVKKFKVSEVSYPLSNAKNPELKKVIELRCKDCDARVVKKELEVKGFASQKRPIELAPEYKQLLTPNDLTLTFTSGDWALNLIGAQCAWDVTTGNPNVIIGISDQNYYADPNNGGVHEELAGKVTYYDTTNIATRTHGTAVAIIAAGNTNNNIGKSSIGFNSRLALYRMTYNDMLAAAAAGIKVINMSWTSGCSYNSYAQQAVTDAYNMGAFLVAAAGNGTTCGGPANLVYPGEAEIGPDPDQRIDAFQRRIKALPLYLVNGLAEQGLDRAFQDRSGCGSCE